MTRRLLFVLGALITTPVWFPVIALLALASVIYSFLWWIKTGSSDYPFGGWLDRSILMIEKWVRSCLH